VLGLIALVTVIVCAPSVARADDDPSNTRLVLTGLAMAPPTYLLGVIAHEGSHALTAKMFGFEVSRFQILPGRHPRTGVFYFGYTQIKGRIAGGRKSWFLMAPKITDALMLGGYALAVGTDTLPDNEYGQLALAVLATGFWVDFSKDILSFRDTNDTVRVYDNHGLHSEWERLPFRLLHLGLSVGAAYYIVKGYDNFLGDEDDAEMTTARAVVLPVWQSSF